MTIQRRQQIKVAVKWEAKTSSDGRRFARLRWTELNPDGGTTRRFSLLGFVTPEQAENARAEREASLRLGLAPESSCERYSVGDLLVDYMSDLEQSPTTDAHKNRVAGDCDGLVRHLGQFTVDAITPHHIRQYLSRRSRETVVRVRRRKGECEHDWEARVEQARKSAAGKPIASTTIKNELATLRRAMRWGKDAGRVHAEPAPLPHSKSLPRDARPPRRLTEGEVRALIAAAGPYRDLVEVFAWSGRRPVAVFALRVRDCTRLVDPALPRDARLVYWRADKGGESTGWGPVTEPTYQAINRRLAQLGEAPPEQLLWTSPTGRPLASTSWPKTFARIAEAAGVENVATYDLRKHACAQILRAVGTPTDAIRFTGHKTVEMLLRTYAYALEGNAEERAASIGWTPAPLRAVGPSK